MTEKEKYILSTYQPVKTIRETESSKVELVESSLNSGKYIKKTYNSDKRAVYNSLSKIKSTHIPEVYEVFFGEDTIIIEQYIEGKTLEQRIIDKEEFSKNQIKTIVDGLLDAIDTLHKNNIVHRDIKPSNIIITENGKAVLIDYSIARPYSDKRDSDTELFGTVGYAAPEQFGFSQSDYRTDIYALGVTLKKIINHQNASKRLNNAILRCTEFDPSRRFQNVDEIRQYINRSKYYMGLFCSIGIIATIGIVYTFIPKNDNTTIKNNETETTDNITINEQSDSVTTELTETVATVYEAEITEITEEDIVIYDYDYTRIVNTSNTMEDIPCIQMWEDGTYKTEITLANSSTIKISAVKKDNQCSVTVNNETFDFEDTYSPEVLSYTDSSKIAEIIFYDMNDDNVPEIIPVMCDAVVAEFKGEVTVLKNYSVAWCIYSDLQEGYKIADGEMYAYLEPFKIYDSAYGCLWTDFSSYYKLEDNKMNLYQ